MRPVAVLAVVGVALAGAGCNLVFGLDPATGGDDDADGDGGDDDDGGPDDGGPVDAPERRFETYVDVMVGTTPYGLAVGELGVFNGVDIAVADASGTTVSVVSCNANRACERRAHTVGSSPTSVAMFDANSDGRLDLVAASYDSNRIDLLIGDGNGGFSPGAPIPHTMPYSVFAGRFAGDANLDLLVGGDGSASLTAYTGNGAAVFVPAATTTTPSAIRALTAGQLLDGGATEVVSSDDTIVRMRQPDSNGGLVVFGTAIPGPADTLLTTDLDGDLHGDLVVGYASGDVALYYGDGLGAFTAVVGQIQVPAGYLGLAAGDLDGDGDRDDLAVATHDLAETMRAVHLFHGDGSRGFTPGPVLVPGGGPREVAIDDADGDGKQDVIMTITALHQVTIAFGD